MGSLNSKQTTILVVEDQFFSRLALRSVLQAREDFKIVAEATTAAAGIHFFKEHTPAVTIVDLRLPDATGYEVIKAIRYANPAAAIVVLSNFDGPDHIRRAAEAGASAYLTKDAAGHELIQAVAAVTEGKLHFPPAAMGHTAETQAGTQLTPRETDVLEQLVLGLSNRRIGLRLGIAEKTVRVHMGQILSKLGASDRTQAAVIALQRGAVDPPPDLTRFKNFPGEPN